MDIELRHLDHFKFSSKLSVNFACEYSEDDRIFIVSDKGIYIVALRGYLSNPFPSFSCKNDFFEVSNFIPSDNIDMNINSFLTNLRRIDWFEATVSVEYSANLNNAAPLDAYPLCAQWSPRGIVGKTDCLLAVLTSLNSLEVYVKFIDENETTNYCMICNISYEVIKERKSQWKYSDRLPNDIKMNEIKRRVHSVYCTAFSWSHLFKIGNEEHCVIFAGHMNGDITVWRLKVRSLNSKEESKPHFLGRYSTQLEKITKMHWHRTKEYGGGLSFADSKGKMSVLHIQDLHLETANMDHELAFFTEEDNIAVDKITVMICENRTYIILVKRCVLIIYGIDELGHVFDQKVCNVGSYYVTGIHHFRNIILILTLPGILKQYTISVNDERICLDEKNIHMKINISKFRTHGFFFSKNMVLFGIVTYPCKLQSFNRLKTFLNVLIFHNSVLNPLNIVWHNNSGSLRDYWDCLEMLRLLCLRDKRFPWLGLPPDLNYDNLSLLQLKTLRWLAKLSEMVFSTVPIIKNYDIKPYIILHYLVQIKLIVSRLNRLLSLRDMGKELSVFQMRSIDIQNFFLKEVVAKNVLAKANVGKNFISEMKNIMSVANELRYPEMVQCIWCGEIIGPVCVPPHADSRCSFSMMPIFLTPSYKCPFCKALAHKDIEDEEDVIICNYCDIPMEKLYSNERDEEVCNKDYKLNSEEVKSVCFGDCLNDNINFSDIEENETDYVIFSDSEDELTEHDKLRTLYSKFKDMSVEQIVTMDDGESDYVDSSEAGPSKKIMKLSEEGS